MAESTTIVVPSIFAEIVVIALLSVEMLMPVPADTAPYFADKTPVLLTLSVLVSYDNPICVLFVNFSGWATVNPDVSLPPTFLIVTLSYPTEILLSALIFIALPLTGVINYEISLFPLIFTVVPSTTTPIFYLVVSFVSAVILIALPAENNYFNDNTFLFVVALSIS